MVAQDFTVDLNKPLVFQVGHLGEAYQEWVHQPIASKEGPRFFESDFWEVLSLCHKNFQVPIYIWGGVEKVMYYPSATFVDSCAHAHSHISPLSVQIMHAMSIYTASLLTHFFLEQFLTRTVWWVIPLIWLPVVCWCISMSIQMGHSLPQIASMVVAGIFVWTLLEYTLHRFLFHIKTKSYWGNTMHYLLHGCHHKHPMDGLRLVFPPTATAVLCVPFWNLIKLLSTPSITPALFGGGLLGYVMYDVTHYYLHHGQPMSEVPRNLKKYHLNHHFRIQNKGFGITSSLWDRVFGTLPQSKVAEKSR